MERGELVAEFVGFWPVFVGAGLGTEGHECFDLRSNFDVEGAQGGKMTARTWSIFLRACRAEQRLGEGDLFLLVQGCRPEEDGGEGGRRCSGRHPWRG